MYKKIITALAIMSAVFAFLLFSCKLPVGCSDKSAAAIGKLVMWGTLPADQMADVLNKFNVDAKTYSISYEEMPEDRFEDILVNALANGEGPDMILTNYKTILSQKQRISPYPLTSFPVNDYKNAYIDGASIFLTGDGILAFPVTVEPMMMFVNRDIISKNGLATVPAYWDDLLSVTPKITKRDQNGSFTSYGVGLGSMTNVVHAKEIIMSLVESLGQNPVSVDNNGALHFSGNVPLSEQSVVLPLRESLKLFTQFSDPNKESYSWNNYTGMTDLDAFSAGKLALYFGYSGENKDIIAKNERLNFYLSPFPQARGYESRANSMKMYGVAVMKRTPPALLNTAYVAQSTLATSKYANLIDIATTKLSPIRSVLSADQNLDSGIKESVLVTRGWYDLKESASTNLLTIAVNDIVSGKKGASEAAASFVSALNDIYAK